MQVSLLSLDLLLASWALSYARADGGVVPSPSDAPPARPGASSSSDGDEHRWAALYKEALAAIEDSTATLSELQRALGKLEEAAQAGHQDAAREAARLLFLGNAVLEPDYERCARILDDCRDPECLFLLGLFHLQSLGGKQRDPGRALAYYGVAAQLQNGPALMALGNAYTNGRFVEKSCTRARDYYFPVAEQMAQGMERSNTRALPRLRLLFNETPKEETPRGSRDVIEFYQYNSEAGDAASLLFLGQVFYLGIGGIKRDFGLARRYFEEASELGNDSATGYLGEMDFYGDGLEKPNYRSAFHRFRRAARSNSPVGLTGMGLMYWRGIEVLPDQDEALRYLRRAAELEFPDANYYYAKLMQEINAELLEEKIFSAYLSALRGGFILAGLELARLSHQSGDDSCPMVRILLRSMLEKHPRNRMLEEANDLYHAGRLGPAISRYMYLAEQGLEAAQLNLAYALHQTARGRHDQALFRRALYWWSTAASAGDAQAMVMTGDYFYYGRGVDQADSVVAAAYYHKAMEKRNLQATFNMAFLHQCGRGVPRDLPMARRYYERALELAKSGGEQPLEAWLPCQLGLFTVRVMARLQAVYHATKEIPRVKIQSFTALLLGLATLAVAIFGLGLGRRGGVRPGLRRPAAPPPAIADNDRDDGHVEHALASRPAAPHHHLEADSSPERSSGSTPPPEAAPLLHE